MSLFDQILSAIDNPNQQASPDQLDHVLAGVQQVSGQYGVSPSVTQMLLTMVGNQVRSSLQQRRNSQSMEQTQATVNQYSGTTPNTQAVQELLSPMQQQQLTQSAAQQTGLNAGTIQAMLPILVPLVLNLLQSGASTHGPQSVNPILNTFLDSNQDGTVDMGDVVGLAGRFLSSRS